MREINEGGMGTTPMKLGKLNFKVYTIFLSTFKKTFKKRNIVGTVVASGSYVKIRLSPSSHDESCSALSRLYIECGIEKEKTSKDLLTQLKLYQKGTRRLAVKERKQLGLAATESNTPLPFSAYEYLEKLS